MHWDYRVVLEDDCYTIRTVYYDEKEQIIACSEKGVEPHGDSIESLQTELELLQAALTKTVLSATDLPTQTHPPKVKRGKSLSDVRQQLGLESEPASS